MSFDSIDKLIFLQIGFTIASIIIKSKFYSSETAQITYNNVFPVGIIAAIVAVITTDYGIKTHAIVASKSWPVTWKCKNTIMLKNVCLHSQNL